MSKATKIILLAVASGLLWADVGTVAAATSAVQAARLDGATLYEQHCASCHRALQRTDLVGGRSLSRIKSSIRVFGVMNALRTLPDDELGAIAAVLSPAAQAAKNMVPPQN